jgi:2-desacetyl-2-hydroxyethyl bacteriochlorophyllide A dehydrogenase
MRSARATGPGKIEMQTVQHPAPDAGEVVVKVRACGICGSDLHFYGGTFPIPHCCPGHEISGEVADVGSTVTGVTAGDRVAVEPIVRCERCWACAVGDYQLCEHFRILGTTDDGGFADFVRAPAYATFQLPAGLDFDVGALTEPLAVGVHGVRLGGLQVGDRVAVLGAGTIGLLAILAACAAGAAEVVVTARHQHQATAARALGASAVFAPDGEGMAELAQYAADRPIDLVIETVGGHADTLLDAMRLVRKGGRIVVLGLFTKPPAVDPLLLVVKEPRIVGSLTYGRTGPRADFDIALDILGNNQALARTLITHRMGLDALPEAFATAADKSSGAIKVTVLP